ncbi:hypothetical protein N374_gp141 [Bacillus phage phiNIT1]|uniref:Uncharacterized protein n=1 Tax=Bacillus phage phiNIT1 TaxID=207656 RepID=S6B5Y5_9CAUD|nr:hypothetical protein N374_gp141 [Bacillus phage phiNIT1]BAN59517.1 hypothetical protein [Bacillus phage phiNIT1]
MDQEGILEAVEKLKSVGYRELYEGQLVKTFKGPENQHGPSGFQVSVAVSMLELSMYNGDIDDLVKRKDQEARKHLLYILAEDERLRLPSLEQLIGSFSNVPTHRVLMYIGMDIVEGIAQGAIIGDLSGISGKEDHYVVLYAHHSLAEKAGDVLGKYGKQLLEKSVKRVATVGPSFMEEAYWSNRRYCKEVK